MTEKCETALAILALIILILVNVIVITQVKHHIDKEQCYQLPLHEFLQDPKCQKYLNSER